MKKGKKLLLLAAIIGVLVVCFTFGASALAESGSLGGNITYTYDSATGEVVISGEGAMIDFPYSAPPFEGADIKSVVIENGITSIGAYTFYKCYYLEYINIPSTIKSIGNLAFAQCRSVKEINISEGVTSLGVGAFEECNGLTSVTIPKSLTYIGARAFNATNVEKVYITDLEAWCGITFEGFPVGSYRSLSLYLNNEVITDLKIPYGVKSINSNAFKDCINIKSIEIPDSVTYIGSYAFSRCLSVTNIEIPKSVTSIGDGAFGVCTKLENIKLPDSITVISPYMFASCSRLTSIEIPNNVKTIGYHAFYGCHKLTHINIPESVTAIGYSAFYNCESLTNIVLPKNITYISSEMFFGCNNLTNIEIPDKVEVIYSKAFWNCKNLKEVHIPASVSNIQTHAFYYCENLEDVYYYGTEEMWNAIPKNAGNTCLTNANIHFIHDCQSDDEWTVISEPTAVSEGKKVKYCTICGGEISEKIPRITIDWKSDENYGLVNFTVVDATTLKPIRNASLNIFTETDESTVYKTDADGKVSAVLPVGKITISASAKGKNTRNLKLNVTHREYNAPLIGLSDKPLVEASIDVKTMTYDEIVNAGISVKDPSNYNVLKYTITFYYEGIPTEVTFYDNDGNKTYVEPDVEGGGYIIGKDDGQDVVVYPNERFYLIIKGEVFWLKQMLEVEMNVYNNSLTDTFEDLEATLIIPEGLSLAAMNEGEQTLVQKLDDVAEGGTTKCIWYVRCDEGGTYNIGVNLKGMLMPWEEEFEESFMTKNPIKVYDENALKLYVKAPTTVECGKSYDIVIGIENISDITLYNVTHTVKNIEQGVVRHYSGGIVVKEVYADEKLDTSVFDAEFKPGDKLEITVNTNILFESEIYEDCIYRLVDAIIDAEDVKTQLDSNFGIYTEHLFGAPTKLPATCTENGEITAVCERCGKKDTEIIPAHGHNYIDGECEHCGDNLTDDCTCNCHKGGIGRFIYKILRIFWKLFKTNQYCACGVAHY